MDDSQIRTAGTVARMLTSEHDVGKAGDAAGLMSVPSAELRATALELLLEGLDRDLGRRCLAEAGLVADHLAEARQFAALDLHIG